MEETKKALSEVDDILKHLDIVLYRKIPSKMLQMIEENKDNTYIPKIDYKKSINEQELLKETNIILSLLYRDYICSPEIKEKLINYDIMKLKQEKEQKMMQYNYDKLFKRKEEEKAYIQNSNTEITIYNKNVVQRFILFIKRLFQRF